MYLFLYFPENKLEYIPAVLELTGAVALCIIVFYFIRRSSKKQQAAEQEKKVLDKKKQELPRH
ncbi:MAG: hypothetical protein KBT36_07135 [Kurthia sp.]|nr:hypothetical protein [Candidatus Kurthia equi]